VSVSQSIDGWFVWLAGWGWCGSCCTWAVWPVSSTYTPAGQPCPGIFINNKFFDRILAHVPSPSVLKARACKIDSPVAVCCRAVDAVCCGTATGLQAERAVPKAAYARLTGLLHCCVLPGCGCRELSQRMHRRVLSRACPTRRPFPLSGNLAGGARPPRY